MTLDEHFCTFSTETHRSGFLAMPYPAALRRRALLMIHHFILAGALEFDSAYLRGPPYMRSVHRNILCQN